MTSKSNWKLNQFALETKGSAVAVFALTGAVMISVAGMAIDYGRGQLMKTRMQSATDAAALAAARADEKDVGAVARKYFFENFPAKDYGARGLNPVAQLTHNGEAVKVSVVGKLQTTAMGLVGVKSIDVQTVAEVRRDQNPIQMVIGFDVSSSISSAHLNAAKSGAKAIIKSLFGSNSNNSDVQVGIVPFSAMVNVTRLGSHFSEADKVSVSGFTSPLTGEHQKIVYKANNSPVPLLLKPSEDWKGCVYARYKDGEGESSQADDDFGVGHFGLLDWQGWEPPMESVSKKHSDDDHDDDEFDDHDDDDDESHSSKSDDDSSSSECKKAKKDDDDHDSDDDDDHKSSEDDHDDDHHKSSKDDHDDDHHKSSKDDHDDDHHKSSKDDHDSEDDDHHKSSKHDSDSDDDDHHKSSDDDHDSDDDDHHKSASDKSCKKVDKSPCPASGILPLTSVKDAADRALADIEGDKNPGSNIAQGLMWSWRVLMPSAPYSYSAPKSSPKPYRAIVLFTDGRQLGQKGDAYKGVLGKGAQASAALDARLQQIADKVKASGVKIFVVHVGTTSTASANLMKKIASSDDGAQYYAVNSPKEVKKAFKKIADSLKVFYLSM